MNTVRGHTRIRARQGRPGWSRRWQPVIRGLKAVGTGLLFLGCMAEIAVVAVVVYFAFDLDLVR